MIDLLRANDPATGFPASWYADTCALPAPRPPLEGDRQVDVAIIGAGFTGLNAALTLAEAGLTPLVIEARQAGWGASGRNGGQVCSGYNKSQRWLEKRLGADTARALWGLCEAGKSRLRDQIDTLAPEANYKSGIAHGSLTARDFEHEKRDAEHLATAYGYDQIDVREAADFQSILRSPLYHGGTIDRGAGHIHPLRLVLALARAAEAAGAHIVEDTEVQAITPGAPIRVHTPTGTVTAQHLIVAGNGYLPRLSNRYAARVLPVNSFIGATAPLGNRAVDVLADDIASADSSHVVNYLRLSEDTRLLFGGRANYSHRFPNDIGSRLQARIAEMFPQIADVPLDYTWGGTLGVTMTRLPWISRLAPEIYTAGGYSGHGVALSGIAGHTMAQAILGQAKAFDTFARLPTGRLPLGPYGRGPVLSLGMAWYALRDRLGL